MEKLPLSDFSRWGLKKCKVSNTQPYTVNQNSLKLFLLSILSEISYLREGITDGHKYWCILSLNKIQLIKVKLSEAGTFYWNCVWWTVLQVNRHVENRKSFIIFCRVDIFKSKYWEITLSVNTILQTVIIHMSLSKALRSPAVGLQTAKHCFLRIFGIVIIKLFQYPLWASDQLWLNVTCFLESCYNDSEASYKTNCK